MKKFSGSINIVRVDKRLWMLNSDWSYQNDEVMVVAKKGLKTDGASIPKFIWSVIGSPLSGRYIGAAIIHDALYVSEALPRKECDDLFLEMMEVEGVSWLKRHSMYWAVRPGGHFVWKTHTQNTINEGKKYCHVERLV